MLSAFCSVTAALPTEVRDCIRRRVLHPAAKAGSVACLLIGAGGTAEMTWLDQGEPLHPAPVGDTPAMQAEALRVLCRDAGVEQEGQVMEISDAYLPMDEGHARDVLGFEPVVGVMYLRYWHVHGRGSDRQRACVAVADNVRAWQWQTTCVRGSDRQRACPCRNAWGLPANMAVEHFGDGHVRGPALIVLYARVLDARASRWVLAPLGMTEDAKMAVLSVAPLLIM